MQSTPLMPLISFSYFRTFSLTTLTSLTCGSDCSLPLQLRQLLSLLLFQVRAELAALSYLITLPKKHIRDKAHHQTQKPNKLLAHGTPSLSYIGFAAKGNTAPAKLREQLAAAIALAANISYASVR
jgi:hypothetical protein